LRRCGFQGSDLCYVGICTAHEAVVVREAWFSMCSVGMQKLDSDPAAKDAFQAAVTLFMAKATDDNVCHCCGRTSPGDVKIASSRVLSVLRGVVLRQSLPEAALEAAQICMPGTPRPNAGKDLISTDRDCARLLQQHCLPITCSARSRRFGELRDSFRAWQHQEPHVRPSQPSVLIDKI
jgi:hypothetical protein